MSFKNVKKKLKSHQIVASFYDLNEHDITLEPQMDSEL